MRMFVQPVIQIMPPAGKQKDDENSSGESRRPQNTTDYEAQFRKVAVWILLAMTVLICASVFYAFVRYSQTDQFWIPIAKEHFSAIVGLPMAALASLCIVLVLRISSGPLEFEGWGLKFKGAAAPIVFWLLCFLAIAASIRMLW